MKLTRKRVIIVVALVVVLFICSWGVVYASADRMLELYPVPETLIADDQPTISANWLNIPGVNINSVEVDIDGKPQKVQAPRRGTGFSMRIDGQLPQGKHLVSAKLTYGLGIPREVEAKWSFTVDTEPPPIELDGASAFFVSPGVDATVGAKSEAGARVAVALNDKPVGEVVADGQGRLKIDLSGLRDRNTMRLAASDKAGNIRSVVLPVIKDETAPVVADFQPKENDVVRVVSPQIDVSFTEVDSGLKSIKLLIDNVEAAAKGDDGAKRIAYLGDLLGDGRHTAKVEAVDYAGRVASKEWSFTVDTRRIVVSRAERKLYFYRNGSLQRVYGVAVGQPAWPTPSGHFRVVNKQYMPTWYNPGSSWATTMPKSIPPGFSNPLGVRAMALSASGVLIHGTSNYGSIGSAASHGCIRMRNSDIVGFFPLVEIGVPVDVVN